MTTQTWPAVAIPNKPLWGTYAAKPVAFAAEFQPDVGPPSRWPRSSKPMLEVSWRLFLDKTQSEALLDFWGNTCKQGCLPFTLACPKTGVSYTWFWAAAPDDSSIGSSSAYNAEIRVRRFR